MRSDVPVTLKLQQKNMFNQSISKTNKSKVKILLNETEQQDDPIFFKSEVTNLCLYLKQGVTRTKTHKKQLCNLPVQEKKNISSSQYVLK